ncbi:unnamed protein product (macronuclear) [Paramecium tetraurelia]|uniref:non-specific serine/threonine protein kinase n=1 Tax=Paramecium tetraurelia TaxID=5888 RepID=A0C025_PARTE|nr:uncharacterized protein GSPATT00005995001 [Paramecium tetraurelia]CAK64142.1 unnamed protein product [Paramecium tetraurelia]|eukprot:XP_001431540.1 hypothetical protein (macronuclear) [Paramecium tetraurelia strain d4-2]
MNLLKFLYGESSKQEANQKIQKHIFYSNDDEYQGEVMNDKRHGKGTYKFASGNRYEGQWKNHQKHGKGKLYYKNGELYIGDWVENKKCGEGMHFYINGDRYVGEWKDDQRDGTGTLYQADQNIFHGQFRMNKKYGTGYYFNTREKKYYKQHHESDNILDSVQIEDVPTYVLEKFHIKPERHHVESEKSEDCTIKIEASPTVQNDSDKQKDLQPSGQSGQGESDPQLKDEGKSQLNSLGNSQQHGFLSLQVLEKLEEFESQKHMQEWQLEEVCTWLDTLQLGEYKDEFIKNQMTGKTLYALNDNDLKQDLGISVLGHRKKILQSIEEYKKYYVKFMGGRVRMKKPLESLEERKGLYNSIEHQRFKSIFSYMEKIEEEQNEHHDNNKSESSSDSPSANKRKRNAKDIPKSPTRSISNDSDQGNLSDNNMSLKLKKQKSKRQKKHLRKQTTDLQKSGESADDEDGKQHLSSPIQSPNKVSNNVSDQKIEILVLNECPNVGEENKEKDIYGVNELSRQSTNKQHDISEFTSSKSPPQIINNNDENITQLDRLQSINLQLQRQRSEANGSKFQEQDSSSQESDVSGNDSSSESSDEEKYKNQKKSRRLREINKKEKEKDDRQQHHLPKKLLVMLKEFGINERVLIVFHELIIGQVIGEGGYGVVHKGKWLGQDVAIKSYGKRKSQGNLKYKLQMADFLKEVEVISNLRHPNIVLYMGVCIRKQNYYLITEYLEEGSLFDHLHKKKTHIDQKALMQIVEDIALGMNYLHGRKVMHCDLKSSNVLIDQNWNVKLCDFGLSRINKKIDHKVNKGARIGTPNWMAPEIMRGEPYQEKADVYSFGMILWEIITQQIPYEGLSQTQIIGTVGYGQDQVLIPSNSNPSILLQLAKKCLKKSPHERPTFADIVNEIQMGQKTDAKLKKQAIRQLIDFFE